MHLDDLKQLLALIERKIEDCKSAVEDQRQLVETGEGSGPERAEAMAVLSRLLLAQRELEDDHNALLQGSEESQP